MQLLTEAQILEEQKREHLREAEHQRLKIEEEKRREEELRKRKMEEDKRERELVMQIFHSNLETSLKEGEREIPKYYRSPSLVEKSIKDKENNVFLTWERDGGIYLKTQIRVAHNTIKGANQSFLQSTFANRTEPPQFVVDVLRSFLLLIGAKPKDVYPWKKMRKVLEKTNYLQAMETFDPLKPQTITKFSQVRGLLDSSI